MIQESGANDVLHTRNVTFNMCDCSMRVPAHMAEPWNVTLVDTWSTESVRVVSLKRARDPLWRVNRSMEGMTAGELISHHRFLS